MPLYVLALTDTRLEPTTWNGRTVRSLRIGPVVAIYETRGQAPAMTDVELRRQHAAVVEIAAQSAAILPARFGSLLDRPSLVRLLKSRGSELSRALDHVRGKVQMTLRVIGQRPRGASTPALRSSGRAYLESRRVSSSPRLPAAAATLVESLRPLASDERRQPGAGALLSTIYHLVDRADLEAYLDVAGGTPVPGVRVTGPWPPFAFAPRIW